MAAYNVQKFSYDGPGDSLCYGKQNVHDHDRAVKFTIDITAYFVNEGKENVRPGEFQSSQPEPNHGKEFKWNGDSWVKV